MRPKQRHAVVRRAVERDERLGRAPEGVLAGAAPPVQLSEARLFAKELRASNPNVIAIMWDYNTPYFSWPFLASGGAYSFKKIGGDYDVKDIGVNNEGAVKGLQAIVELINSGTMPKGASYSVMEQKMNNGELAMMVSGPWAWANLQKNGIDFGLAPLPGIDGNPGRPFVGVLADSSTALRPIRILRPSLSKSMSRPRTD